MKKFFVIGNPIEHSLSPKLHNFLIQSYDIKALYERKKLEENEIEGIISKIRKEEISGINVTVPFKQKVIPYLDELSLEAEKTQSVNTICFKNKKLIGHNTDITGFRQSIEKINFDMENKKIFLLGAGGVVPSIIYALNKMKVSQIKISNRTIEKAENLKNRFENLEIIKWGDIPEFDVVINATSLGLKKDEIINIDFSKVGKNKLFYDIIYNPGQTHFLDTGNKLGNKSENGKLMFIYQGLAAFDLWHGVKPNLTDQIIKLIAQ